MRYLKLYEYFMFENPSLEDWEIKLKNVYEYNFRFRYKDLNYEEDDFINIKNILERDCKKFLNELKSKKQLPLFRGVKNKDDVDNGIFIKSSRTDRKAKDSNPDIVSMFDEKFLEKLGIKLRSSGVFVTKNPETASDYGTTFMFFPIGEYKYYANKEIRDLYSNISDYFSNEKSIRMGWEYNYNRPNISIFSDSKGSFKYKDKIYTSSLEDTIVELRKDPELDSKSYSELKNSLEWVPAISFEEFLKSKKDEQDKMAQEIVDGYVEGKIEDIGYQEITFICDKYYLVDTAFYDMMCNYLEDKPIAQSRVEEKTQS